MRCRFVRKIFCNRDNGYCVFVFHTMEEIPKEAKDPHYEGKGAEFTAKGDSLPDTDAVEADLQGTWIKGKYGLQFQTDSWQEIRPQTEEGIQAYLCSGMIKGIGPRTAELIVKRFGARTFDIMEQYPESLLEIRGITQKKLDAILDSYRESRTVRDLAALLAPFDVTPKKIQKIYECFGNAALETVKSQPFALCSVSGFGFLTVDKIARAMGCCLNDPMRIDGCIDYCMEQELQLGNLYQEKQIFQEKVYKQLNTGCRKEAVTELEVYQRLYQLVQEKHLYYTEGALYPAKQYAYECGTARALAGLLSQECVVPAGLDILLKEAQRELSLTLSSRQEDAVRKAFTHLVSIVTGGPGTGKTTVQKVMLHIYEKLGGTDVLLTAPTGRASRRMAESTGHMEAMTMHSALGLTCDEDSAETEDMLEAGFIIADEFTMSDMRLSFEFFCHIRKGSRLVLVGDIDQLPSVGPGNVFRELVQCGVIPVTVLDTVFRQGEDSRIITNAHRMQENNTFLDYGEGFTFIPAKNAKTAGDLVVELYRTCTDRFGTDQVQVLSPYRRKGDASVNALNERLWEICIRKEDGSMEIQSGGHTFRIGDRIIHNKNRDQVSNGDIGYVTDIYEDEEGTRKAKLTFSDGRAVDYTCDEMDMVEHAYATTVHKSQGSEYPVVILPWITAFYGMLKRNIFYTAITRAKQQVLIVGDKRAVVMAIHNTEFTRRNTRLGERVIQEYNRIEEKKKALQEENGYWQEVMNL